MKFSLRISMAFCVALVALPVCAWAQSAFDYDALVRQGNTQLQAGNKDAALASASAAIKVNVNRWEAYAVAGGALMNLKRYEEAADQLGHAIDKAPESKQTGLRDLRRQCLAAETATGPAADATAGQAPPTWTDPATGLMWAKKDNDRDVSWQKATNYCRNLTLGGYSGWQLPTIDELAGIYDQTLSVKGWGQLLIDVHVKGNLQLSGYQWSSSSGNISGQALVFEFNAGSRFPVLMAMGDERGSNARALCVRASGQSNPTLVAPQAERAQNGQSGTPPLQDIEAWISDNILPYYMLRGNRDTEEITFQGCTATLTDTLIVEGRTTNKSGSNTTLIDLTKLSPEAVTAATDALGSGIQFHSDRGFTTHTRDWILSARAVSRNDQEPDELVEDDEQRNITGYYVKDAEMADRTVRAWHDAIAKCAAKSVPSNLY